MDREQEEMQFLGVIGICKEAYKIVVTWRKIFSQITFALIFPLSFVFLAHIYVPQLLTSKIIHNEIQLDETPVGATRYNNLSDHIFSERLALLVFNLVYLILVVVFSLLATSAVVYTIACIYTAREVSFNKIMSVVPKVWKRLMLTFLSIFLAFFLYTALAVGIIAISAVLWTFNGGRLQITFMIVYVGLILYGVGLVYMSIVWQLANTVSVMEEWCGFKAMGKSKKLLKGKMWVATLIYLMLSAFYIMVYGVFKKFVVYGGSLGWVYRVGFGILCLSLVSMFFLFTRILEALIYFVCKSYHHENIDKTTLSDQLDVYMGDYMPLKAKDVQLEHFQV